MPRKDNAKKCSARELVFSSSVDDRSIDSASVKAVIVGINYIGTPNQLGGCINDALQTKKNILAEYPHATIRLLTDNLSLQPTRNNILDSLKQLVSNARAGDILIFHYSGHGGQVEDLNGDEEDGMDETICPIDFAERRVITIDGVEHRVDSQIIDDEIHDIIDNVPKGARFLMLSDSCHSGTVGDLRNDFTHYDPLVGSRSVYDKDAGTHLHFDPSMQMKRTLKMRVPNSNSGGELRVISGCEESRTSADTGTNGACTKSFWETVKDIGGLHKFFPMIFSHNVQDLKFIQDNINKRLSDFGFTQQSVISWEDASPELAHEVPTAVVEEAPMSTGHLSSGYSSSTEYAAPSNWYTPGYSSVASNAYHYLVHHVAPQQPPIVPHYATVHYASQHYAPQHYAPQQYPVHHYIGYEGPSHPRPYFRYEM